MNFKNLIFYLLLLFSNNIILTMDWFLEHPKTSLLVAASTLLVLRNYLFKLACKYNCYNIVKLCNPNNWLGYKVVKYDADFLCNPYSQEGPLIDAIENKNKETITALLKYPDIITNQPYCYQTWFLKKTVEKDCQEVFDAFTKVNKLEDTLQYAKMNNDINLIKILLENNTTIMLSEKLITDIIAVVSYILPTSYTLCSDIIHLLLNCQDISLLVKLKAAILINDAALVEQIILNPTLSLPEAMPKEDWLLCYGLMNSTSTIARLMILHKKIKPKWRISEYLSHGFVDQSFLQLVLEHTNEKTYILLQTLYHILTQEKEKNSSFINFLLNHPDMNINEKVFNNGSENILHQLFRRFHGFHVFNAQDIIQFTNRVENIDFSSCNNEGITLFYRICCQKVPLDKLTFFTTLSIEDKKKFANQQLQIVAQRSNPSENESGILDARFLEICTEFGGGLNERNAQGNRPIDTAHEAYLQAMKIFNYETCTPKRKNYYYFLQKTPYISDEALLAILIQELSNNIDVTRKIMGYYTALTIDRHMAIKNSSYKSKYEEECAKKELLDQICIKRGYLNPDIHHGNNTMRNRLAIT